MEQKVFTEEDRTDRLLKVISGDGGDAVLVHQDAHVFLARLNAGVEVAHDLGAGAASVRDRGRRRRCGGADDDRRRRGDLGRDERRDPRRRDDRADRGRRRARRLARFRGRGWYGARPDDRRATASLITAALLVTPLFAGGALAAPEPRGGSAAADAIRSHAGAKRPAFVPAAPDALSRALETDVISPARYALERARSLFSLGQVRARFGRVAAPDPRAATCCCATWRFVSRTSGPRSEPPPSASSPVRPAPAASR